MNGRRKREKKLYKEGKEVGREGRRDIGDERGDGMK